MKKYSTLAFFALSLLSLALGIKAVSQVEASDRIAPYLGEYREAVSALDKTLESAGERFWVFYAPIKSQARIIAAVSDFDGRVLTDKAKMSVLASLVYKKELVDYLKENKLSLNDLAAFSESLKSKVETARHNYNTLVAGVLDSKYPSVDFTPLGRKLDDLSMSEDAFSGSLAEGTALQSAFEQEYSDLTLNDLFNHYNKTFDKLSTLFTLSSDYKTTLYAKDLEVKNRKDFSDVQKQEIRATLIKLDIDERGDITSFKVSYFDPIRTSFSNYLATSETWVNNSVEGFFYRQAKVDAQKAYDLLRPKAIALLAAEYDLVNYMINISNFNGVDVKKEWKGIENIMTSRASTSEDYALALQRMQALDKTIDAVNEKYARYITATPRPRASPAPDYSGYVTPAIGVILVVLIAYGVYNYYKKKAAAEEEETSY